MYNSEMYRGDITGQYISAQPSIDLVSNIPNPTENLEGIVLFNREFIDIEIKPSSIRNTNKPKIHGWVPICSYLLCLLPFIDC